MFCSQCGTRLLSTARYCEECGTSIVSNTPSASSLSLANSGALAGSLHVAPQINVTVSGTVPTQPAPRRGVLAPPSLRSVGWWGIMGLWSLVALAFTGSIRMSILLVSLLLLVSLVNRALWSLRTHFDAATQQGGFGFLLGSSGLLLGSSGLVLIAWAHRVAPYIWLAATFWLLDLLWLYGVRRRL